MPFLLYVTLFLFTCFVSDFRDPEIVCFFADADDVVLEVNQITNTSYQVQPGNRGVELIFFPSKSFSNIFSKINRAYAKL